MSAEPLWDVFESESLTVMRGLSTAKISQALNLKELTLDDLIRPSGSSEGWQRLGDTVNQWLENPGVSDQDLLNPDIEVEFDDSSPDVTPPTKDRSDADNLVKPSKSEAESMALSWLMADDDDDDGDGGNEEAADESIEESYEVVETPEVTDKPKAAAQVAVTTAPVSPNPVEKPTANEKWLEPVIELEPEEGTANDLSDFTGHDDEDEQEFTLSRSATEKVEELDLAAMVDVAFQLVLFFMVTASVTLIKTMDLPKPTESSKPAAATAPGIGTKSKNEVETEFIVVSINANDEIEIDDEQITTDQLLNRLREVRTQSGKTGMLLRAENKTKHRTAVLAYDAANEIGLRIAIERETSE